MARSTHAGPATVAERFAQTAPFVGTFVLAIALALLSPSARDQTGLLIAATLLVAATATAIVVIPWPRLSEWWTLGPVVLTGVIVHLLRAASGGGLAAGFGALVFLPVVWQALHRRLPVMWATVAVMSLTNLAAIAWLDSTASTVAQWRALGLFSLTAAGIGHTVHTLSAERDRLLARVRELATTDTLTGLPNRRAWDERAVGAAGRDRRAPTCVAIIDLDRFKAFNDTHGHDGGDELLVAAAKAWAEVIRDDDLLVRWGGEEFALLLPATDAETARIVLERMQAATPLGQTFSAGIAVCGEDGAEGLATALRRADDALYRAKADGRARVSLAADEPVPA